MDRYVNMRDGYDMRREESDRRIRGKVVDGIFVYC
jgi:hypothetical protein